MGLTSPLSRPTLSLTAAFIAWKCYLLTIAIGTLAGSDYDTSTSLFFQRTQGYNASTTTLPGRLTRWDALYYMRSSRDGYVFEQDWAFGAGLPLLVRGVRHILIVLGIEAQGIAIEPVLAIAVAHMAHFIAVLSLYHLTVIVFANRRLAFVASLLHVLAPAGLFLSAPHSESPFACLTFLGNLLFAVGCKDGQGGFFRSLIIATSGAVFGLAAAFRSNGLLSGIPFAVDAFRSFAGLSHGVTFRRLVRLASVLLGGSFVATGVIIPQVIAWKRYCYDIEGDSSTMRPWCLRSIPSIYSFVQEEYWNVGFLRYWTLNQLPMFILAGPMLFVLITSGVEVLRNPGRAIGLKYRKSAAGKSKTTTTAIADGSHRIFICSLATEQAILASLAITNYHVQVINRLSSGYPIWCWWIAALLASPERTSWGRAFVVFAVMYASIQGALFSSFLPPA